MSVIFDSVNQLIYVQGRRIQLPPKAFALLDFLRSRAGQLVTKDELLDIVWPSVCVGDAVLKNVIREIRRALGDDPRTPRYIETVHRRGYRFIGELPAAESTVALKSPVETPSPSRSVLIGHQPALTQLQHNWAQAINGESQFTFINGEPGIGKSALVKALLHSVGAEQEFLCVQSRCVRQHTGASVFLPILDTLTQLCKSFGREQFIALLEQLAPGWLMQMPWLFTNLSERRAHKVTASNLQTELAALLEAVTQIQPLLIVLEDLQHCDHVTLDLLNDLARLEKSSARLFIIGTASTWSRPAANHPLGNLYRELVWRSPSQALTLGFLNQSAVAAYLCARCPGAHVSPSLTKELYHFSEGHPLLLASALDWLIAEQALQIREGEWTLHTLPDSLPLPYRLCQVLDSHKESLDEAEQAVLEGASLLCGQFSIIALAKVLEQSESVVEEICESLVSSGQWLNRVGRQSQPYNDAQTRYRFTHAIYRRYYYDSLPATRRQRLLQRRAMYLEHASNYSPFPISASQSRPVETGIDASFLSYDRSFMAKAAY